MSGLMNKVTSVAIAVTLVFFMFPVNTGFREVDKLTHEKAEAVAVPIAPIVIFGTLLAAYGVYAAGNTTEAYNANVDSLYKGYAANQGMTTDALDSILEASVTGAGTIALGAIGQNVYSSIRDYILGLVDAGTVLEGANSSEGVNGRVLNGVHYSVALNLPDAYASAIKVKNSSADSSKWLAYSSMPNGVVVVYYNYNYDSLTWTRTTVGTSGYGLNSSAACLKSSQSIVRYELSYDSENQVWKSSRNYSGNAFVYDNYSVVRSSFEMVIGTTYPESTFATAVVDSGFVEGAVDFPTATVEPFEPTAEQLEAGYTNADVVEALNTNTGTIEGLSDIVDAINNEIGGLKTGVSSLTSDVASIENIWSGLKSTPFGWLASFFDSILEFWGKLMTFLGRTPLAELLAPVTGVLTWLNTDLASWLGNTSIGDLFSGVTSGISGLAVNLAGIGSMLGTTPLSTLLSPLAGIGSLVGSVPDITNPLDAIAAWIGTTPIGTLFGDVSTAINTGVGTITQAVNDVNSWLGTLNGWWEGLNTWAGVDGMTLEGILEGLLSGALSGTLAGTLADVFGGTLAQVIEAIQSAALDLTASIDGIMEGVSFPEFNFPKLSDESGHSTFDLTILPNNPGEIMSGKLAEKAPFAYVVAINEMLQSARGTYDSEPTFYWEVNMPVVGGVRVDAGPWLNHEVNGTTIAFLLRVAFNSFVVVMLLGIAYTGFQRALAK